MHTKPKHTDFTSINKLHKQGYTKEKRKKRKEKNHEERARNEATEKLGGASDKKQYI